MLKVSHLYRSVGEHGGDEITGLDISLVNDWY